MPIFDHIRIENYVSPAQYTSALVREAHNMFPWLNNHLIEVSDEIRNGPAGRVDYQLERALFTVGLRIGAIMEPVRYVDDHSDDTINDWREDQ